MARRKRAGAAAKAGDLGPLPAAKRVRSVPEAVTTTVDAILDMDSDDELLPRKKDDIIIDEEGSFFFATPINGADQPQASRSVSNKRNHAPPTTPTPANNQGCIQFVSVLPSEKKRPASLAAGATASTPTPSRPMTRGSLKARQAAEAVQKMARAQPKRKTRKVLHPTVEGKTRRGPKSTAVGMSVKTTDIAPPKAQRGRPRKQATTPQAAVEEPIPKLTIKLGKVKAKPANASNKERPEPRAGGDSDHEDGGDDGDDGDDEVENEEGQEEGEEDDVDPEVDPEVVDLAEDEDEEEDEEYEEVHGDNDASEDARESKDEENETMEQEETGKKGKGKMAVPQKFQVKNLTFTVQKDGANEILQLPFNTDFDTFRYQVAELLVMASPDMRLAYRLPGMKKTDFRHLRTRKQFKSLIADARKSIDFHLNAMDNIEGNGKRAIGQRATVRSQLDSFVVEIRELSTQSKSSSSKQREGSKTTVEQLEPAKLKEDRYRKHIKDRKCKTCKTSCGVIVVPGKGLVHVPLNDVCIDAWVTLSLKGLAKPYDLNPPSAVLDLLRTTKQPRKRSAVSSEDDNEIEVSSDNQLTIVPRCKTIPNDTPAPSLTSSTSNVALHASAQSNSTGTLLPTSLPQSFTVGGSPSGANSSVFSNMAPGVAMTPGMLSSLANQFAQFASSSSQPQVLIYGMPGNLGLAMPQQALFPGLQATNLPMGAMSGFQVLQMNGNLLGSLSNESERNTQG